MWLCPPISPLEGVPPSPTQPSWAGLENESSGIPADIIYERNTPVPRTPSLLESEFYIPTRDSRNISRENQSHHPPAKQHDITATDHVNVWQRVKEPDPPPLETEQVTSKAKCLTTPPSLSTPPAENCKFIRAVGEDLQVPNSIALEPIQPHAKRCWWETGKLSQSSGWGEMHRSEGERLQPRGTLKLA